MALRSALHQAGAAALTQLLQFPEPAADQRKIPCECGQKASYRELRTSDVCSPRLGEALTTRPYYLCPHCRHGQFPVDAQIERRRGTKELSPGVRRMLALVGAAEAAPSITDVSR